MKPKILKSIGILLILIAVGLSYNLIDYGTTQEYAKSATQQVNDDSTYYLLQTKSSLIYIYRIIYVVINIAVLSLLYFIWKPKQK